MNFRSVFFLLFATLFFSTCDTSKKAVATSQPTAEEVIEEFVDMDTMTVSAKKIEKEVKTAEDYRLDPYNPSFQLRNNILHTKLELSFDWAKQHVMGKATLTLKPYFYPTSELRLDAVGFDIHKVIMMPSAKELVYKYDGANLIVQLGEAIPSNKEYKIFIDYTAKPTELPIGGSAAITSDQGLFFINHDGSTPDKPMQIWTQGETENNSRWFPTIDKPNERCTQEMYLTVQDRFKTLSNGDLISSTPNGNGTRTDYWKMDKPHAPYLFMLTIGEFAVVKDNLNGMLVDYYVEPKYKDLARDIFPYTPEMISFFSKSLGYDYPWSKYSQVVVRDYVSGAMENTTGVIFGEFMQMEKGDLVDVDQNELIVAHELFHHWFGDLVTCESWANLTMNEGFANYGEYLWLEHKYGPDAANRHRFNELNGYLGSVMQSGAHPLIHFAYEDKEQMFDAHSYNKGGLVLHMLRQYVGDQAFWASLHKYLKDNEYTAVEAHDLRLAFEEVCGEDLNWFFNQWYFSSGHPELKIETAYDASAAQVLVTIEQIQDPEKNPPIFVLPMAIDIYATDGSKKREQIKMTLRKETFTFPAAQQPALVNVDAEKALLCTKDESKTTEELIFQYQNGPNYLDRQEALSLLSQEEGSAPQKIIRKAMSDKFWSIRRGAVANVDLELPGVVEELAIIAEKDNRSQVRAAAFERIGESGNTKYLGLIQKAISNDQANRVSAAAFSALSQIDTDAAIELAKKLEKEEKPHMISAIANLYAINPDPSFLSFYERNWGNVDGYDAISFFEAYSASLQKVDIDIADQALPKLTKLATDEKISPWKRFASTKTLFELKQTYGGLLTAADATETPRLKGAIEKITNLIATIKAQEKDQQLQMIYGQF